VDEERKKREEKISPNSAALVSLEMLLDAKIKKYMILLQNPDWEINI
jgi:hypothetical protein